MLEILVAVGCRAMTDLNSRATVLSVDGIGACDRVLRSSMLGKLLEVPRLRALIPFVRTAYAQPTSHEWEDQHGLHPLDALLFCVAVHNSLIAIKDKLRPGGYVFAFLDDICVVFSQCGRVPFSTLSLRSCVRAQEWSFMQEKPGC